MNKSSNTKGIIFLVTAAVVWGFAFVAQRLGADNVPAFFFNFARFFIGTVSLIPVILIFERNAKDKAILKNTVKAGIIAGVLLAFASYLQQLGIATTDSAGKSGFITGLYMIIIPVLGIIMRRKTSLQVWFGALFGLGGLFLVCMSGGKLTFTHGDVLLIISAFIFALHIIVIDLFGQEIYSLRFAMVQFAVCTVINFAGALLTEDIHISQLGAAAIPILYCGFMSVGVAYTCQILGQKYSEPTSSAIILSTESVFSAIGGAIILHERMSPPAYIGCALILCGIIVSRVPARQKAVSVSDAGK